MFYLQYNDDPYDKQQIHTDQEPFYLDEKDSQFDIETITYFIKIINKLYEMFNEYIFKPFDEFVNP
jgi:hypothetical protein